MGKTLVIQLHRLGDVIQSTPAIESLRRSRPEEHIAVLTRKSFAAPLAGNPHVDELIPWDLHVAVEGMPRRDVPLDRQYPDIACFARSLREKGFDQVINLANDILSAVLVHFIGASQVSGLMVLDDASLQLCGPWMHYLFTASANRALSSINICDALRGLAGAPLEPGRLHVPVAESAAAFASAFLAPADPGDGTPLVAMQPGASKAEKRWPVERFARLADLLCERHGARVVVVGTADELPLAEAMQRTARARLMIASGRTDLGQLAALIRRCTLLISNDTATVHVAAAVATPTLVLSFGPTYSRETAPYAPGHLVMEPRIDCFPCLATGACRDVRCAHYLSTDAVLAAAEIALGATSPDEAAPLLGQANLWRTIRDSEGFLDLEPLLPRELELQDVLRAAYRSYWLSRMLDHREPPPGSLLQSPCAARLPAESTELYHVLQTEVRNFATLEQLASTGGEALDVLWERLARTDAPESDAVGVRLAESIGRIGQHILENDHILSIRPLIHAFGQKCYENQSLPLVPQIREQRAAYRQLAAGCRALQQMLQSVLDRPARIGCTNVETPS